jgi:hypothetical protein
MHGLDIPAEAILTYRKELDLLAKAAKIQK